MRHRDHADFSESTDEIAPLTEEEKKARLEELRKKLSEKRANESAADKEKAKLNEVRWLTLLHRQLLTLFLENSPESHQGVSRRQGGAPAQGADQGGGQETPGEAR